MDDTDFPADALSDEEQEEQAATRPHFEEFYSDEAVQDELSRICEEDAELAQRLTYLNDCGLFGRDTTAFVDEAAAGGDELAEPRAVADPVAETARIRNFMLNAASNAFESAKAVLISRKRAATDPKQADERLRERALANVHFNAALTWIRSRFERLEDGRYPPGVFWPLILKPRTLEYCARSLSDFVSFLFVKRVLVSGERYSFESLDDFASTKTQLYAYIEYYIGGRPLEKTAGIKKSAALQRQKKMTAAEKLQASGKPLPGTVISNVLALTRAFRLLCLSNPSHSGTVWIGDRTRKQIEEYVYKNFGAVSAHSSWPLLYEDVLYAIEEQPPENMTEWSRYILLLMMTKFGFRPSSLLQIRITTSIILSGTKSTGILFEDITSISYDKDSDKWKIVFSVTYSKTDNSPSYSKLYTITSENYKGDLARILVAFFAVRGAFERPLHEAMDSGTPDSFKIREEFLKLSIFGGMEVGQVTSRQYSNTRVPTVDDAKVVFKWFCTRIGLPEGFLTPRSARQGFCFSKCFAYLSEEKSPTYEECIKKARGLREWTSKAAETYLRPNELPIEQLITTVMEKRRRYPNRPIDAYDEYMTVSKLVRLPNVQGPTDVDSRAIEALGKLAEESHFKRLKSRADGIAAEVENLVQSGKSINDPDVEELLNQWGGQGLSTAQHEANMRKAASRFAKDAKRKASNLIKTDYIRRAIHGSIVLPTLPPLSPMVLDVVTTSQMLASRTHCRWSMTQFAVTYPLALNQLCLCPFDMCGYRTRQVDGHQGIVAHMKAVHFQSEGELPSCRKHPERDIYSVDDWLSHWNDYHRYFLCFDCAQGDEFEMLGTFSRGHVIGTLCFTEAQPLSVRGRHYALHQSESDGKHTKARAMDGVHWIYADPAPHECNCQQSRCPYNDNPLIPPLLEHDEYLTAGALTISPAGQGASRWSKRKWFLMMAGAMLVDKYTSDEIERCLDYYFNKSYPPGSDTFVHQPPTGLMRVVPSSSTEEFAQSTEELIAETQRPSISSFGEERRVFTHPLPPHAMHAGSPPRAILSLRKVEHASPQTGHVAPEPVEAESIGSFMRKFIRFWQ